MIWTDGSRDEAAGGGIGRWHRGCWDRLEIPEGITRRAGMEADLLPYQLYAALERQIAEFGQEMGRVGFGLGGGGRAVVRGAGGGRSDV